MRRRIGSTVMAAVALWALALAPGMAGAAVSSNPAATPQLGTSGTDGTIEVVRQMVQCGNVMYAVGKFTHVKNGNSTALIARNNAFAFSAVSPYRVTTWNPNVNGQVDTVACSGSSEVLIGGVFTAVGGKAVKNIARVSTATGGALPFNMMPGGRVAHIEVVQGHALVGGYFPGYLKSLNPTTGVEDGYGMPAISGNYVFPGVKSNPTRIWNMTPRADGEAVLMTGVFNSVGGKPRQQIFRLNLTPGAATVSNWYATELDSPCSASEPFYAQDAAWSPDGTTIYTATTGYKPYDKPAGNTARTGPCDAAIAYSAAETTINGHTWINYTGCDSLYSVAADSTTVFIGGHQRWISNPATCDKQGPPPARPQPGLGEINPADGTAQPGPNRGRGLGAADLLRTGAGLWIASDNQANSAACAGKGGHMGICFLPN
jgi:hypothetical protein